MALVLASASPRRKALLAQIVSRFSCLAAEIDERPMAGESAEVYVRRVAQEKAEKVALDRPDDLVIGADTTVVVDQQILGKPIDRTDARRLLSLLSGRTHQVMTAVALSRGEQSESITVITDVTFAPLSAALIARYLDTEEPWDKAGAYGIQGFAGTFVTRLSGSYSAVVGLPLCETRILLANRGWQPDWAAGAHG